MKSWISATFIVGFLLMCGSASGAGFCVVPVVPKAVDRAEAVFSGKIVDLVKVRKNNSSSPSSSSEYIVKFEIEEWWKGTQFRELRVLWRPEIFGCPYYPVGEIGERYLVYADSPRSGDVGNDRLLEITVLNRTGKIPRTTKVFSEFGSGKGSRKPLLVDHIASELNRSDASNDIDELRRLRECACLLPYVLPTCMDSTGTLRQPTLEGVRSPSSTPSCCTCLRRTRTFSTN
jgi:hypothetical protein